MTLYYIITRPLAQDHFSIEAWINTHVHLSCTLSSSLFPCPFIFLEVSSSPSLKNSLMMWPTIYMVDHEYLCWHDRNGMFLRRDDKANLSVEMFLHVHPQCEFSILHRALNTFHHQAPLHLTRGASYSFCGRTNLDGLLSRWHDGQQTNFTACFSIYLFLWSWWLINIFSRTRIPIERKQKTCSGNSNRISWCKNWKPSFPLQFGAVRTHALALQPNPLGSLVVTC